MVIMKKSQTKSSSKQNQGVRIIGGQLRRRQVEFVNADGLRPTPDRLRETLFNWLRTDLLHANVLDICAGSGVLGFEALSHGAHYCTFIEKNFAQYKKLMVAANTLGVINKSRIIYGDALIALQEISAQTFDVVFIDPPYHSGLYETILSTLITQQRLTAQSLLYIEHNIPLDELTKSFALCNKKSAKIGQIYAGLFQPTDATMTKY